MSLSDELRRTARNQRRPASPDDWPRLQPLVNAVNPMPFPINDAFPPGLGELRAFVQAVAEAHQVPVDMPAMLLLPILSVTIASKYEVEPQSGWREPAALWTCTLAKSGERKSAVFAEMLRPLYEWQAEKAEELRVAISQQRTERAIAEKRLAFLQRKAANGNGTVARSARAEAVALAQQIDAEVEVRAPDFVVSEPTTEALAAMLAENRERALVAAPEGDVLDVLLGRYSGRPNFGIWLAAHGGDAFSVKRRGREPDILKRPALSVVLCVQPSAVEALLSSSQAHGRGFLARMLFAAPPSKIGRRDLKPDPVPPQLAEVYADTLRKLLAVDVSETPEIVGLAPKAGDRLLDLRARIEPDLGDGGALEDDASWGSKLPGAVARIALALHVAQAADCPDAVGDITEDTMCAALAWTPYLRVHEATFGGVVHRDPTVAVAERVRRWIATENLEEFSRREAYRTARGPHVQVADHIDPALGLLIERGWIRELPAVPRSGAGRRPSPRFTVNPQALGQNGQNRRQ